MKEKVKCNKIFGYKLSWTACNATIMQFCYYDANLKQRTSIQFKKSGSGNKKVETIETVKYYTLHRVKRGI